MRILVVDDSKAMRLIVIRALRGAGFGKCIMEEAGDGAQALERLRVSVPDLVLCDWNMPVMSGPELLEAIKKEGIKVRFGFVTSEGTPEFRQKAAEAGALFVIAKPFTSEIFQETLGPLLGGQRVAVTTATQARSNIIDEVTKLLSGLVGKKAIAKPTSPLILGPSSPGVAALFIAADGSAAAASVADVALAARLGASLTMVPKTAAEGCIQAGLLTEVILDNFREVLNVASRLFNVGTRHTRLSAVHCVPQEQLPAPLAALLAKPAKAAHLEVDVEGYGTGRISLMIGPPLPA